MNTDTRELSLAGMFGALYGSRELIAQLVRRDWIVRYRQSFLGAAWALVPQLVTVTIFTFLTHHRVFAMGETPLPYILYSLWGFSLWQLFASTLISATVSLTNAGSLVTKSNFRKEALILAPAGHAIFDFLIRLLPLIAIFIWYGYVPGPGVVFVPVLVALVLVMALGAAFFLAPLNLVFKDVGNAISILMTFGMFLAPVLYAPPVRFPFSLVNVLNPFSPLLIATHQLIAGSPLTQPLTLPLAMLLSLALFYFGWRFFVVTIRRIAERA